MHHLAQINVGRLLAPIDDEQITGFVAALDPINALADAAPGFVWRLQTEDGNATSILTTPDPLFIVNMSVWESVEALGEFVYSGDHREILRGRRQWFEHFSESILALWWVPVGHLPTTDEALDRLELLRRSGPTAEAFTFRRPFGPPDEPAVSPLADDRWGCPA